MATITWTSWRGGPVWNSRSSTRSSTRSCTWVRATPAINTVWGIKEWKAALPRRTWGHRWMKSWIWATDVYLQPRRPTISWAASREARPAGWGREFCPSALLWWDLTWSPVSSSEALSTRRTRTCWSRSRGGPQKSSEGWSASSIRKGWESWGCSVWKREDSSKSYIVDF